MRKRDYIILTLIFVLVVFQCHISVCQIFGSNSDPKNYGYDGSLLSGQTRRLGAITKYNAYLNFVISIIGIIGMVGAFKIYNKWQQGEEIYKDLVRWGSASLAVPIAYVIISKFFLNT